MWRSKAGALLGLAWALAGCTPDMRGMGTGQPGLGPDDGPDVDEESDETATTADADGPDGGDAPPADCDEATQWFLDLDGDGFGDPEVSRTDCAQPDAHVANDGDCDDTSAAVNPEATERCDEIDNDCDGLRNEPSSENTACEQCTFMLSPGVQGEAYAICDRTLTWDEAQAHCDAMGGALVTVDNATETERLHEQAPGNRWIGLSDVAAEGVWVWADGTPLDYTNWHGSEPNGGEGENCAFARGSNGAWVDSRCTKDRAYACELPVE